ncbi:MAG: LysR family transcriptional regulator, partial [Alphaproteobacteria bacterium HGW-Alphaproteobacteria-8]
MMKVDLITLKQLRALAAVARCGSITAAAEALHLTPPAVHSQIKGLEGATAATLLQRTADSAGSRLTPAGEAMLRAAGRVDVALSQAVAAVRAIES